MAKKKSVNFQDETNNLTSTSTDRPSAEQELASPGGGRPLKSAIHSVVAAHVLRLYVSFLKQQAPASWTNRQTNFELFTQHEDKQELTDGLSVANGMGMLLRRKSIPRLVAGQFFSQGILKAESMPRFSGGLQILYHPYVRVLSVPRTLEEIQSLIALCRLAESIEIVRHTSFGTVRTYRSVEKEIESMTQCIERLRGVPSQWKTSFVDIVAIAFGLACEAFSARDLDRFKKWKKWFMDKHLLFAHWPVGDIAARQALDRWIEFQLENWPVPRIDVSQVGFAHMLKHVVTPEPNPPVKSAEWTGESEVRMSVDNLMRLFLTIRDGKPPTAEEVSGQLSTILGLKGDKSGRH